MIITTIVTPIPADRLDTREVHAAVRTLRHGLRARGRRGRLDASIRCAHQQIDHGEHENEQEEFSHGLSPGQKAGRGERIRTSDSCVPNAVLYQAELRPDGKLVARKDIAGTGLIFQPGNSSLQTLR